MRKVSITKHICRENLERDYGAGQQTKLIIKALPTFQVIFEETENDWQGNWLLILKLADKYYVLPGTFGSCSGCDDLEGVDPIEWLTDKFQEVYVFDNLKEILTILKADTFDKRNIPEYIPENIRENALKALEITL